LDLLLGNNVDVGRGLVQQNDFIFAQNGPAYANKLFFSRTQVATVFGDFEVQLIFSILALL
jgi:hypothetical protein